ncbi:MAG: SulP family inorganic anion transporter [Flavobacteriaceae bacterium]|nr:SulP family inorganic anion transporter [Bacteroidia bacterium]NNF75128.1 SulP family inorganic anion transporter [Flavobacteriaceae bacterium]
MRQKPHPIKQLIQALPRNIFSGFVVSLIALPLGLGLAMASDAPPIAGIISAIVGGLVVAFLGGSYVTITGPGNGLVGVILVAITTLGLESAYAAIMCSGGLLLLLGGLRLGKLADFFPSSAIQGMLAAIGLIILGKQFHIMLGNRISRESNLDYLTDIPATIKTVFSFTDNGLMVAAVIGILSLIIMVVYPRLRNKYLQLIPAPMWIVLLSIGFSYYFELIIQKPNPIHPAYLISGIPNVEQIVRDLPTPNFEKIIGFSFWSSVLALTLIASIESLLSIKAIDKLDPEKRRSNVNKDLKALGLATIGSGYLGGLNVVTVIARSSVNVNNGGSNRSANFFHAVFLLLFIVLFSTQLARIPLPALMAILVYTGYKLASPDIIKRIFSIGKEQLVIFFVTLIVTLQVGIITGILMGVITTFIIHLIINKEIALFARNLLKPNVLMYKEGEGDGIYYVSVKHFCSFLNYYKLKDKLNAINEDEDVVVDFSLCQFVDHTVMENLNNYQDLFKKRGGHFEVIGLDMHGADSEHPFALRRLLPIPNLLNNFTRRQSALQDLASDFELTYNPDRTTEVEFLANFLFFRTKQVNHIFNQLIDQNLGSDVFDIEFSEGAFIAKEVIHTTMMHIKLDKSIPEFTLDREGLLERFYSLAGFRDIPVDNHPDFNKRFYLLGEDETAIQEFFGTDLIHFFESNPYFHVESNGSSLLLFGRERLASLKEIKALLDFGHRLKNVIQNN